jgi:hypothetical protein
VVRTSVRASSVKAYVQPAKEAIMALEFLGKDPESEHGSSPTVYYDPERKTLVIQSWKPRPEQLVQMAVPDHETAIELPLRMMQFFPEVNGDGDRADTR